MEAKRRRIKYCLEYRCVRTIRVGGNERKGFEDFWEVKRGLTGMIYGSRRKALVRSLLRIQVGQQVEEAAESGRAKAVPRSGAKSNFWVRPFGC